MGLDPNQLPPSWRTRNPELFAPLPSAAGAEAVGVEVELHEEIYAECRRRGWIAFHGSMAARTHRTLGEPDFIILADAGRLLLVECKTRTGKLTPEQAALMAHAAKLGHRIHVVRSMKEFQEAIAQLKAETD